MTNSPAPEGVALLDGGVASELERAGLPMADPWWTTDALRTGAKRQILQSVHEAYLAAGAQVITANTFRTNLRALSRTRLDEAGRAWMVHAAVGVAGAARKEARAPEALIAGSIAPVEDAYRPDLVPPDDELRAEHRWLATELSRAGVDLYLLETMNTIREARIALEQVLAVGGRAWVGFACGADGRLISGEDLSGAVHAVQRDGAEAVLVNCSTPEATEKAMRALCRGKAGLIGAYPNNEDRTVAHEGAQPSALNPEQFAELLVKWRSAYGLDILGGCCGVSPAHLAAARDALGG
ncbi:homocysteine S-methyltransferase family protein [Nocardia panacis]|uniref:Homocysteine S-methyltransferase family protein n=1 Tax=Nocardia panacis TaxID=2340916 RepID=A0A3A4KRK3_9NOCA|nr:homocysteine S-methyltransferase family protein [Nocardia panacis]RJO72522.1 homocysteine S-methyltransferase family protein [Nocardia panacis]